MFLRNSILLLLCMVLPCMAQTKTDDDVVRITTNLVQVDVVVTKKGKPIKDLKAEDFEIFEDGKLQTITSFTYGSNVANNADVSATAATSSKDPSTPSDPSSAPPVASEIGRRRIAFVVDDCGLSAQSLAAIRRQLRKFIDEQLKPNRPSTETFNKQFHKIRARGKTSGYEVRTRSGFFGMSEEEAKRLKETTDK